MKPSSHVAKHFNPVHVHEPWSNPNLSQGKSSGTVVGAGVEAAVVSLGRIVVGIIVVVGGGVGGIVVIGGVGAGVDGGVGGFDASGSFVVDVVGAGVDGGVGGCVGGGVGAAVVGGFENLLFAAKPLSCPNRLSDSCGQLV